MALFPAGASALRHEVSRAERSFRGGTIRRRA
jgi:hypothetical protein